MKLLQIFFFCTAIWLVRTEQIRSSFKDAATIYKEEIEGVTLHNYTFNENSLTRERRSVISGNQALQVMTFNIENYFSTGKKHARDSTIVAVRQCIA